MTNRNGISGGPKLEDQKPLQPLLDYGCSDWKTSSQRAANLYRSGVKLWRRTDLADIEGQLAQSYNRDTFTVRCIDGNMVQIQNPMVGEEKPVWKPHVKFQDYWRLVKEQPTGPTGTYHCSYLVEWSNQTIRNFRKSKESQDQIFEKNKLFWNNSKTCRELRSLFEKLLGTRKVTKIICFGLGEMCRKPPDWLIRQNESKRQDLNISAADRSRIQHSIALTIADACRNNGRKAIQLLAQDPDYSVEAMEFLEKNGFKIVGQFGAGGFADIDEDSVVFSPFVNAPVKQIIADIARPALIISTGFETFNDHEKPWADAESPRTEQMWQEYQSCDFPISSKEVQLMSELHKLKVYVRTAIDSACNQ